MGERTFRSAVWKSAPALVLAAGCGVGVSLGLARPEVPRATRVAEPPAVRAISAERSPVRLDVYAQGSVAPKVQSDLVAEVSGRVIAVAPKLAPGAHFARGDELARLAAREFEIEVKRAKGALQRTRAENEFAQAELRRKTALLRQGVAARAMFDAARRAAGVAHANVTEAEARVSQAELDLARSVMRAPFSGRVRSKNVDVGQFVTRGTRLAELYSTEAAEIQLSVRDRDLALLELPTLAQAPQVGPAVEVRARIAGVEHSWSGRIVRTLGELDPETKMVRLIAEVLNPEADLAADRPALAIGTFVDAYIEGRTVLDAIELPEAALRGDGSVFVVSSDKVLRKQTVELLRRGEGRVYMRTALRPGDRICITSIGEAALGTVVRVVEDA